MASGNSREKPGRTGRSARHRMVVRTESLRIPNWHDTGSTSPRSVGEVALIWDTISHYSRVLIAPLAIISSRRHVQKKIELALGRAMCVQRPAGVIVCRKLSLRHIPLSDQGGSHH